MTEKELVAKMQETLVKSRKELANIDLGITRKSLPELDKIIEHLSAPLMIMVMGEFSTGKSTFINAMVGEEVTAVNATPTTAVITKLCYGTQDKILVHFTDGTEKEFESSSFKQLTAKTGKDNEDKTHEEIEYVERQMPLDMLQYVTIIDSPGLNDINEKHSDTTKKFVNNADTVFWMFNALHAASKTEVDALETLTPRLKPIAIINLMDKIDEEEDDPQEFLDNLRVQLKDKVQAVVGISAKYALEGKLGKNETKIEIGNLKELEQVVQDLVLPNRNKFKLNTLMDELGEWTFYIATALKSEKEINQTNKENYYNKYLAIKGMIQKNEEIIFIIMDTLQSFCIAESKRYNEQAIYLTGLLYYFGICLPQSNVDAEEYWEEAALKNHSLAQKALASYYILTGDNKKAFTWHLKIAEQNNADYQFFVGRFYENGYGVKKDTKEARYWYKRAAELGNKNAREKIAQLQPNSKMEVEDIQRNENGNMLYEKGIKFYYDKNWTEAEKLFIKAAEKGHVEAQYLLGRMNDDKSKQEHDNGVKRWYNTRAEKWYFNAAKQGHAEAQYFLGLLYENDGEIDIQWYYKAAEQGHLKAQFKLGKLCEKENNIEEAKKWYYLSAKQGYMEAQHKMGMLCEKENNLEEAEKWYASYEKHRNEQLKQRSDEFLKNMQKKSKEYKKKYFHQ